MDFEEWAELYALDYEPLTTDSRRSDCKAAWEAATKTEREACAKACETVHAKRCEIGLNSGYIAIMQCAEAIRERSNAK